MTNQVTQKYLPLETARKRATTKNGSKGEKATTKNGSRGGKATTKNGSSGEKATTKNGSSGLIYNYNATLLWVAEKT